MAAVDKNKQGHCIIRYTGAMKAVLIGNYGVGNWGDEALCEYFLRRFPDVDWTVVTAAPTQVRGLAHIPRLPFGPRSLLRGGWVRTLRAMRSSDVVVFGGGSLFTDVESIKAPLLWGWHAFVARLMGKRIFLAFQGIGPFRTGLGRWISHCVIRWSSFVSLRDEESVERLPKNTKYVLSFDPILSVFSAPKEVRSQKVLVVIPRHNSGRTLMLAIQNAISKHQFDSVSILSLQPDAEKEICVRVQSEVGLPATIIPIRSLEELQTAIVGTALVISERFHGALAAMALSVPVQICSQKEGDKLSGLKKSIEAGIDLETLRQRLRVGEKSLEDAVKMIFDNK
jgi:polysaccharide pyruvyl transferase WcaK-like protein